MELDVKKLRAMLFEKNGMTFDESDPIFSLVLLNEAVLEQMLTKQKQVTDEGGKKIIKELQTIVTTTVTQIAEKEAEARVVMTTTKKVMWMIGGGLVGMAMFGLGVSYGAVYSTWTNPAWIDRSGLLSVLSSALLKTPIGGVGCIAIALMLVFMQRNITDSFAENEADVPAIKILSYLFTAMFAALGLWLNFLMIFK